MRKHACRQDLKNPAFIIIWSFSDVSKIQWLIMEVLTKGPILHWTSDGKLHERFLEWTKKFKDD